MSRASQAIAEEGEGGAPPSLPRKALKVPPYEKIAREAAEALQQDPLKNILLFPADNLEVTVTPKESRTTRSILPPPEAFSRGTPLFVQRCLDFYKEDWTGVRRRYLADSAEAPSAGRPGLGQQVEASQAVFEVDLGEDGDGSPTKAPRRSSTFSIDPILSGPVEYSHQAVTASEQQQQQQQQQQQNQTPGRRDSKTYRASRKLSESSGVTIGKTRKGFAVLRFETMQGPLVLEMFKDEKRAALRERIDLTESSSIELVPSSDVMFRLNLPSEAIVCAAESPGRCEEWVDVILAEMARWNLPRVEALLRRGSMSAAGAANAQSRSRGRPVQSMLDELNQPDRWDANKMAEPSRLFRYFKVNDGIGHIAEENDVEPLGEWMGHRFVVRCGSLFTRLLLPGPNGGPVNPEPLACRLALYDLRHARKVSEDFHFDLSSTEQGHWVEGGAAVDHASQKNISAATRARQAVFSVQRPHADIWLVLHVEKVLQADIATVAELYTKGADNYKAAERQARTAAALISRDQPGHTMPLVWAARPVFSADGELLSGKANGDASSGTEVGFSSFFRHEPDRMKEEDLMRNLGDLSRVAAKQISASKLKMQTVPGVFEATVGRWSENFPTVDCTWVPVKPFNDKSVVPRREVHMFPTETVHAVHTAYHNLLYVYPMSANFASKKLMAASKARNIVCVVQLLQTDEFAMQRLPTGSQCVFGKASSPPFVTSARTAVTHHNKVPDFLEEVKMALPANITPRHHLFFTFLHVSVDQSKKGKAPETAVGYAFLPLLRDGKRHLDGVFDLPVVAASTTYTNGTLLPPNYARVSEDLGMGQKSGPSLRYLDGGRPLFQVRLASFSSIHSDDDHLRNFFEVCERHDGTPRSSAGLCQRIKALHAMSTQTLFHYMPPLFNQLLSLLPASIEENDEVSVNTVRYLIYAVGAMHQEMNETPKNPLLAAYVRDVFRSPPPSQWGRTVHGELVRYVAAILGHEASQPATNVVDLSSTFVKHAWFFLELIAKSMVQTVARTSLNGSRAGRFTKTFYADVNSLFDGLISVLEAKAGTDLAVATSLNKSLAVFTNDLFGVADRGFVFSLVERYVTSIVSADVRSSHLIVCKFDYLGLVCGYEHYIPLNLPRDPETMAEAVPLLNYEFKRMHYLAYVIQTEVSKMMDPQTRFPALRHRAIATLRMLIAGHEGDRRYGDPARRNRVCSLYFPVLSLVLSNAHRLHKPGQQVASGAMASQLFSPGETRDLLVCFLFVIQGYDRQYLTYWWATQGFPTPLFDVLGLCIEVFRYRGKEEIISKALEAPIVAMQAKKLLEEQYSVDGLRNRTVSNASTVVPDRDWRKNRTLVKASPASSVPGTPAGRSVSVSSVLVPGGAGGPDTPGGPPSATAKRRFRFSTFGSATGLATGTQNSDELEQLARMEDHLSTQAGVIVLGVAHIIIDGFEDKLSQNGGANTVTQKVFQLLLCVLRMGPSTVVIDKLFQTLRLFTTKYTAAVFNPSIDICQELCLEILHGCNSRLAALRDHSALLLYYLVRQNMPRMSLDLTVALSKIAGGDYHSSDQRLRESTKTVAALAKADPKTPSPDFPAGVGSLMKRLRTILIDTEQMKRYEHDPEMLIDLQYRVADSYSNAPELRITWLESMARIHIAQGNWSEAAMCVVHGAGIVAERLKAEGGELQSVLRNGCAIFKPISRNVSGEKYISWQSKEGGAAKDGGSASEITSPLFTKQGLIRMLRAAVYLLKKAERYELVSPIYGVFMPILEQARRYGALAEACTDLQECFERILQLQDTNRRHLGTFFRVAFAGRLFGGMDGRQFIYKEPNVTPLATISLRLKALFEKRFGNGKVEMITDSKEIDRSRLDASKAYLQITYVEPHFSEAEAPFRQTYFEKNHNNFSFSFETPFTRSGKAHGPVGEQCMRVTILEVPKAFPYIKKRIQVTKSSFVELEPIDVAIEEMTKKVNTIRTIVVRKRTDMKMLQMQLQGSLSLQVNAGPMEYASVFLKKKSGLPVDKVDALRRLFYELIMYLEAGLHLNASLIGADQEELQADLKTRFLATKAELSPLIDDVPAKPVILGAAGGGEAGQGQGAASVGAADGVEELNISFLPDLVPGQGAGTLNQSVSSA